MAQIAPAIIKEAKKLIKNNKEEWVKLEEFPYIGMFYFAKREIIVAKY